MANIFKPPCDEASIRSASSAVPCAPPAEVWILAATIHASSMAFIDGTVVNVALPALQRSLGATALDVQWIVESYALSLAALLLVGGSAGDRFGRRLIFCSGVALFTLASVACAASSTIGRLIAARTVQGLGAALLIPGSLAILSASFAEEGRDRAIATWSGFTSITAAVGSLVGGWLIEHFSLARRLSDQRAAGRSGATDFAPVDSGEPRRRAKGKLGLARSVPGDARLGSTRLRAHRVFTVRVG
jgi:MFS family permease